MGGFGAKMQFLSTVGIAFLQSLEKPYFKIFFVCFEKMLRCLFFYCSAMFSTVRNSKSINNNEKSRSIYNMISFFLFF